MCDGNNLKTRNEIGWDYEINIMTMKNYVLLSVGIIRLVCFEMSWNCAGICLHELERGRWQT